MEHVLAAIHQANLRRRPIEFIAARRGDQVGIFCRFSPTLQPAVVGQLAAMYPQVRVELLDDATLTPPAGCETWQATLQLKPRSFPLKTYDHYFDDVSRTFIDPLATLLNSLAAIRGGVFTPSFSFTARPAGRLSSWLARRAVAAFARKFAEHADRQAFADKYAGHLYHVELRLMVAARPQSKAAALAKLHEMAGVLGQFSLPKVATWRLSRVRRGGPPSRWFARRSVVSCAELATLWHPATTSVQAPAMLVERSRELEPPPPSHLPTRKKHDDLAVLGRVRFRDRREAFGILPEDRMRHLYVVGKTGVGKSTLLLNMIAADIAAGRGVQLLDPHGDLCNAVLETVPRSRTNDVILFDAADRSHPVGFNPLHCRTAAERPLVASAVVSAFKRMFGDSWGPRLEYILRHAVLTLIETPGTTLASLQRLLVDEPYRKQLVGRLSDPIVRDFWQMEWDSWKPTFRAEAVAPIQNKVGQFVSHPILRGILDRTERTLDLRRVLDEGRVLLCNLSKGRLGDDASNMLGSLLVTSLQLAAMSRADLPEPQRRPAFLYVDEFQSFVSTESFATILSEARKYRLGLVVSHQYLEQLDEQTAAAVFGNVGTIVAFQVGRDAEVLAEQLGDLEPADLRNLPKYQAYVRLLIDGLPSRTFSMSTLPPQPAMDAGRAEIVRRTSARRYTSTLTAVTNPA